MTLTELSIADLLALKEFAYNLAEIRGLKSLSDAKKPEIRPYLRVVKQINEVLHVRLKNLFPDEFVKNNIELPSKDIPKE